MGEKQGVWLRGNLHMHTQRSDGQLGFEDAVALYEQAGYDFVAVTDHWVLSEQGTTPGGMLLLPGCEYNVGHHVREGIYHIVGVGMQRAPAVVRHQPNLDAQQIIDAIRSAGGLAILAHPAWSLNSAEAVSHLTGLSGVEIYNTTSGFPYNARPYSGLFVDQLGIHGVLLPCMAADDAHHYDEDAVKSYLMVHAREKTHAAVMEALWAGQFYATQGPRVELTIIDQVAHVTCSPASRVVFYSDSVWNAERVTQGNGITQASCRLTPRETFVRAEITDKCGRTAYTSPIRVPGSAHGC